MKSPIDVLGGITIEQFLTESWQKKPLLVRNALPEIADILVPDDVLELALDENITARLIKQKDKDPNIWSVKNSPLSKGDFQKMPKLWTLLVQAVDHYCFDLAALWNKFPFIPAWRRDDIMVSYAPKGGSVGRHFDYYDVFLVQGYGHRRWTLGQMCDATSQCIDGQPLKLLSTMETHFDEILAPGDLLYVPPGMAHYGVAEDECLTYSFGFRMPNVAEMMDRVSDKFMADADLRNPLVDILRNQATRIGEVSHQELEYLKNSLIAQLSRSAFLDDAMMSLLAEAKYPENIPDAETISAADLADVLEQGFSLQIEPASRLIYLQRDSQYLFWANGEAIVVSPTFMPYLKQIADGAVLALQQNLSATDILSDISGLLNESILMLVPPEDE